ncbi:hypothetical protein MXEN_12051 [Mycobacterium xenopi RIVM700367]|uniref:Uncharacterized protein n=1 Tax=Mycobacterium botniense TaxID=84962 RepID=A0A7I9XYA8_9MYCO|nr:MULTISPECIES: hypothetical protein [Mycobacterium]EID12939.1 hypothetical protein MXEN_12051 [Mycobacterium xenopi RIVM700367]GFG74727.1 hypothetical protein MBOT_20920 [Mycobacterium botniense]
MSGYRVIAPLVVAKDQTGRNHHVYAGGWLPWLDDEQRAHFLAHGLVEEVDTPATVASPGSEQPEPDEPKKPPRVAPKETWVEYGVAQNHDRRALEALSKQELVDLLG